MLANLNHDEKLALAGILKWIVSADPQDSLDGIVDFFNEHNFGDFNAVYKEMNKQFEEIEDLQAFLKTIGNNEAHRLIIKVAKDIALSDAMITRREKEVFIFLKTLWNIDPATVD